MNTNPFGIEQRKRFPVDRNTKWAQHKEETDAFGAFGKPVSTERQVAALDCAVEVIGVEAILADPIIRAAAKAIERDEPSEAITYLMNIVDLTGAYRLIAVMCTDE